MFIDISKIEKGFQGSGIELDASDFEGDWDYIYARYGTSTHVFITKYKIKDDIGNKLPVRDWKMKGEYYPISEYREYKLSKLI